MLTRLRRLLAIRPGEAALVARLAGLFAAVEGARGVGEIGADTLVIGQSGTSVLPYLYVGLGCVSLVAALAFGIGVGRLRRRVFFPGLVLGLAILLVVERGFLVAGSAAAYPIVWLTVYVVGTIVGTLVWALAGWVLDARQAKRLFPLCASAAILGGFIGMISAGPIAGLLGTPNLILAQAALLVVAAGLIAAISRSVTEAPRRIARSSVTAELRVGFDYVRHSRLMRLIAGAYIVFAVLYFSVNYPFLTAMKQAFPTDVELATALGVLSATTTAVSFLVAVALANRAYARFGIATVALLLPLVYLAGFGVWLVRFSLATAVGFRFAQQVTQRGLSNAIWSAFYNVVPGTQRAQVLAFMDGVPGQVGITLAGLLLLAVSGLSSQTPIFLLGIAAALVCVALVLGIRRTYAASLVQTLRAGLGEQLLEGGPGLVSLTTDPAVVTSLRTGLSDEAAGVRRLSAMLLGRLGEKAARPDLEGVLDDPDPTVRVAAIGALTAIGIPLDEATTARLGADPDPAVRAEVAIALIEAGGEEPSHSMLVALIEGPTPAERVAGLEAVARLRGHAPTPAIRDSLTDPVPDVRAAAVRALAAVDPPPGDPIPALLAALDDEASVVRLAAAHALGDRGEEVCPAILATLRTGSDRAQGAALTALQRHGPSVAGEVTTWALAEVDAAARLRRQRSALRAAEDGSAVARRPAQAPGTDPAHAVEPAIACIDYLTFVLRRRERTIEELLVHALAVLGAPEAAGVLSRSLTADDAETRAIATEALDSIGDRRLARAVVGLLEDDGTPTSAGPVPVLHELLSDDDPWTRTLAARALDPGTGAEPGDAMPDATAILSEIERMLVLRRVALFTELAPEDLQRVAAGAVERLYAPGEALVREGDPGDELIVIVEGTVRVVRRDGDGERLIRTYSAGDHIGELAVLREHPRVATVLADGPGVRGLAISGTGLKAILRERPEAAMAMLATLAERLAAT